MATDVAPQLDAWKKEAAEAVDGYKVDAWREWAPQWLVLGLFVDTQAREGVASTAMMHEQRLAAIEKLFEEGMEETMRKMEKGELSMEQAQLLSQQLERHREENLRKADDFAQWEAGNANEEEEVVPEKGKGREVEKEEEKEEETEVAPQGWRPDEGAQVRPLFFSSL